MLVSLAVLLKDPRVDVALADEDRCTPLWCASYCGHFEVVEWLIASGRDLGDVMNKKGIWGDDEDYTALEIAREEGHTEVESVLENFLSNPTQTRHELRVELGVLDALAAEIFALTVFLCDDLLHLKPSLLVAITIAIITATTAATRFFAIAKRLPMELQMVLCHRAVGSMKQDILRRDSEPAFHSLAKSLLVVKHCTVS